MRSPYEIESELDSEFIREALRYDEASGKLFWNKREELPGRGHSSFNKIYAEKEAGFTDRIGYRRVKVQNRMRFVHRIIWFLYYGEWPSMAIDHIDGDRLNNKIENLRLATRAQNKQNSCIQFSSSSGLKGVSFHKETNKWQASIRADGKIKYLGVYPTKEAHEVYKEAAVRYFGEFARFN